MGKKDGGKVLPSPPIKSVPCCRALSTKIDDGFIGEATVHRKDQSPVRLLLVAFGGPLKSGFK